MFLGARSSFRRPKRLSVKVEKVRKGTGTGKHPEVRLHEESRKVL